MAAKKKAKTAKKTTAKTEKKASASKGAAEMLLVGSKTREVLKKHDVNVSADALEGANAWVYWLLDQAAKRAAANGRKTVRAHDFMVM